MKRYFKIMLLVIVAVITLTCLATSSEATEMKTMIGIVNCSGLRLRAKPNTDASIISTASYGDNVVIIRKTGDWYLVNYNLDIGYMYADYLNTKERENVDLGYGSIDPAVCNMRSTPATSGSLVSQVRSGEKVYIFGFNCGWYKCKYNGNIGYIRSDLVTLLEKPYCNSGSKGGSGSGSGSDSGSTSLGQQIANYAQGYLGYPYVWGGNGPNSFDCSGFVKYVYAQYGITINRTATAQMSNGYSVSRDNLKPGDLVFFYGDGGIGHVGMYIGNNKFIHASNPTNGVIITDLSVSWYANRYAGARRIVG
ncbi:MAG: C40 family peptidase [Clostridia bacterium]|nr:C40 family peptidase [Clostridia bacterium]